MTETSTAFTRRHTILIIDDTPINLSVVVECMQQRGFSVAIAQDGEEGLQRAEFAQPGLILLDVMLPGLDGFEVCRRLKANARTRDIPVIFMTALSESEDKVRGFAAGGVDYVTKPLQIGEVVARVDTHLKLLALQKQLGAQNAQLQESRENLERQVAQRTIDLHESNRRLHEEIGECKETEKLQQDRLGLEYRLSRMTANIPGFLYTFRMSPDGRFNYPFASEGIRDIYGVCPEDVLTNTAAVRIRAHPDDRPRIGKAIAQSARDLTSFHIDFRVLHPVKGALWVECRSVPEREPDGSILWHGVMLDIAERKCMEELLHKRGQEFRELVENSPDTIIRYDVNGRRTYLNPSAEKMLGASASALLHKKPGETPVSSFVPLYHEKIKEVVDTASPVEFEFAMDLLPMGRRTQHFHVRMVPEYGSDGRVAGVLGIGRDIAERKRMEDELRKRGQEFRELVEHSPDTIARYDRDYRRVYANQRLVANMGGDMSRILGTTPVEFPAGATALAYQGKIQEVFERGEKRDFELHWQAGDVEFCLQVRMTPEFDRSGEVVHVLAVGRDITEIDQYRKKVHHQAFFDSLTGLPNRLLLSDRISQTIADAAYHGLQFGLMLLDLDNFKQVNDTLGHGVGDRLLCETAKRMQDCVRIYDTVARLGGDEFAILLPDVRKGDDLATIAGKILHALTEPFVIDGRELFVTGSIGIALYPGDSTEIDALYKYADSAMYHAKKMGRNNFQFYETEFTTRSLERMEIEAALRKAQKNGELVLYYQPQIELQSGRVTGAEALLRWCRPGHGMVVPDRFIPLAEESGMIVDIGEWVLSTACQAVVCWNRGRANPVRVAVNLSTRQFIRNDLVGSVRRILAETGCKAEWLELEITESLLLEDGSEVAAMLAALHSMGLSIAIDDFGTGYSALSYLNRFPVSQIKIDRSFVNGISEQRDKRELAKAILSIAAALRLESVAEGVETPEQAAYLMAHGCRLAQGYLFGKPMPLAEFEAVLAQEDKA